MEEQQTSLPTNTNQPEGNLKAALVYFFWWITGLIFLITEKKDKFVRFHAAQSLVVFGGLSILLVIPLFSSITWILLSIAFILWVLLMFKAYKNEEFELPLIADLARQIEPKI